ncbi:MAG: outer membrane protein assembly factor BamD [Gemmatimonadetes bacterium]|nr:outer membrane protein assembly factor BamD [Gemmatimonadota bacterium]
MTSVAAAAGLLGCLASFAAGCASAPTLDVLPADEEYTLGTAAYAEGDYGEAAERLNRLVLNYPEDPRVPEVRYLLGQANFRIQEYPSAAQDFERFQGDFPNDSLADDALYWAGRAYEAQSLKPQLDQADTRRAISSYSDLVRQYSSSGHAADAEARTAALRERLAEKEMLNVRYYFKHELWKATEIYARSLIEEYPQSAQVAAAYLILLRTYEAQGKAEDAARVRQVLLDQFPQSPEAEQVRQALGPAEGVSLQARTTR